MAGSDTTSLLTQIALLVGNAAAFITAAAAAVVKIRGLRRRPSPVPPQPGQPAAGADSGAGDHSV